MAADKPPRPWLAPRPWRAGAPGGGVRLSGPRYGRCRYFNVRLRAKTMIAGSYGRYSVESTRDHEQHGARGLGDDRFARGRRRGKIKDAMPTDLTVILEHRPGELARLGEITGEAGVSIRGLAAFTGEGRGVAHLLLDDQAVAKCREALERAGIGVADQREVLVVDIEDRPGALGELARRLAEANVNIELAYTTFGGVKVVIATDDLTNARASFP